MNVINREGATVDGTIGVIGTLSRDPEACIEFYGQQLNSFLETAVDALHMVRKMPSDPLAFMDGKLIYTGKAQDLEGLNTSISSLEFIKDSFTLDDDSKKSIDKLLKQLQEERFNKFGKLINWSEVHRFINNVEKEKNKKSYRNY